MDPKQMDDQNETRPDDRNEDEEFVPGPLDEPTEANDDNELIEEPMDDEDRDIEEGID